MAVLHKLQTGLDVNVKFTGVRVFEYTPECIVFDLLDIPLYHGWLVDPQVSSFPDTHTSKAFITLDGIFYHLPVRPKLLRFSGDCSRKEPLMPEFYRCSGECALPPFVSACVSRCETSSRQWATAATTSWWRRSFPASSPTAASWQGKVRGPPPSGLVSSLISHLYISKTGVGPIRGTTQVSWNEQEELKPGCTCG